MGATAAVHLWHVCANVERVLAVELLCGAQGLDFLRAAAAGAGGVGAALGACASSRRTSSATARSRPRSRRWPARIRDGSLLAAVEAAAAAALSQGTIL